MQFFKAKKQKILCYNKRMRDDNISPLRAFFRNKRVRIVFIIDIVVILIVIGIFIYQSTKTSTIVLSIAPVDANISINGNGGYSNGRYPIAPGMYEIKISHDGLQPKTLSVNIEPGHYVTVAAFLDDADDDFAFYRQKTNYKSYQKLKAIASADNNITIDKDLTAQGFITNFEHTLSIKDKLPIKGYVSAEAHGGSTGGFAIREGMGEKGCKKIACLLVNYFGEGFEEEVPKKIKEAGFNPDDYQLIYKRYTQ